MSERLRSNESFLRYLHEAKLKQRNLLLNSCSRNEKKTICECAFNIAKKNIPLTEAQITELRKPKNKKIIYLLADKSIPLEKKWPKVVQSGGSPIALIASIISSIVGALASR